MMLPFMLQDLDTVPFPQYRELVSRMRKRLCVRPYPDSGVAYLTIDEAALKAGEFHRRPGLHVDGAGGWGGGGGGWGKGGFLVASNLVGCRVWVGTWQGTPSASGEVPRQVFPEHEMDFLRPNFSYLLGPMTVHESTPMVRDCKRQFIRISLPNNCPWYEGYTESPYGIKPTGPILPRRKEMDFRP